ncbi:MAG: tRNA (N(6)-L-threonylcarbamoyladenosine(37)-C(2))-methylthiotransferase MtaB [Bacteroidetes bacterium GWE2_29_8]|nr:MAG: tRNA (N(6)-L-threonylcarbamoyladenosine(37)-C(2))-methylthiotransferase MtaB [Bacteroidetes bacterium GWE2_29_8]OFY17622.1 MAG: tRNA (N(6)-L-threonylcarbamoyladenosine(37)-C(2))-methylthiotransferase MtaB [Bacteroidetes bacterium GWF2_29_10]
MSKVKIAFYTFGCKVNYTETSSLERLFEKERYEIVSFKEEADIYIINSCAVTSNAEKKCRFLINQTKRLHNDKTIFLIGCYAEKDFEALKQKDNSIYILNNANKFNLKRNIEELLDNKQTEFYHTPNNELNNAIDASYSIGQRTRSFVKIQDGCDFFCSYCIIPYLRGRSRSANKEDILNNIKIIAANDVKEIVLTGINIGKYGIDNNENFLTLLKEIEKIEGIERIRISSIEPNLITDEMISFFANSKKYLPHFHIPLQSGCDRVLKLMNRKYNTEFYKNRIEYIKQNIPNAFVATDLIVGFPDETEEDFNTTCNFIKSLPLSFIHVFTYSERGNTKATELNNKVTELDKKTRSQTLHQISEEKQLTFYNQFKGYDANVLFETDIHKGMISGFTENYIKVKTAYKEDFTNQIIKIKLNEIDTDGVFIHK